MANWEIPFEPEQASTCGGKSMIALQNIFFATSSLLIPSFAFIVFGYPSWRWHACRLKFYGKKWHLEHDNKIQPSTRWFTRQCYAAWFSCCGQFARSNRIGGSRTPKSNFKNQLVKSCIKPSRWHHGHQSYTGRVTKVYSFQFTVFSFFWKHISENSETKLSTENS